MTKEEFAIAYRQNALTVTGKAPAVHEIERSYRACLALAEITRASEWELSVEKDEDGQPVQCFKVVRRVSDGIRP